MAGSVAVQRSAWPAAWPTMAHRRDRPSHAVCRGILHRFRAPELPVSYAGAAACPAIEGLRPRTLSIRPLALRGLLQAVEGPDGSRFGVQRRIACRRAIRA